MSHFGLHKILPALFFLSTIVAIDPIKIVGNKFFDSNSEQFLIHGFSSELSDRSYVEETPWWSWDASECKSLTYLVAHTGGKVMQVEAPSPDDDTGACIQELEYYDLHMVVNLGPKYLDANATTSFAQEMAAVDKLAQSNAVLGFLVSTGFNYGVSETSGHAETKATIRDIKAYINQKGYRKIPVGYSLNVTDVTAAKDVAEFYACGDRSENADFFAARAYRPCLDEQKYDMTDNFGHVGVPIYVIDCLVGDRLSSYSNVLSGRLSRGNILSQAYPKAPGRHGQKWDTTRPVPFLLKTLIEYFELSGVESFSPSEKPLPTCPEKDGEPLFAKTLPSPPSPESSA